MSMAGQSEWHSPEPSERASCAPQLRVMRTHPQEAAEEEGLNCSKISK